MSSAFLPYLSWGISRVAFVYPIIMHGVENRTGSGLALQLSVILKYRMWGLNSELDFLLHSCLHFSLLIT